MLLEPGGWSPRHRHRRRPGRPAAERRGHASAETHACVVELATRPHRTVADAVAELGGLRAVARTTLRDARPARPPWRARTRPSSGATSRSSPDPPLPAHRRLDAGARAPRADIRMHVHVGVPDPGARGARAGRHPRVPPAAARALRPTRRTGRAATRARLRADPDLLDVPARGIARAFGDYRNWVAAVDAMERGGRSPTRASCGGTPAAAAVRHRRGAGDGCPDTRGGHRGAGGARAVARQVARGGHPPARGRDARGARGGPLPRGPRRNGRRVRRRLPRRRPRAAERLAGVLDACRRSRTRSDASRSSSPPPSSPRAQVMPGSA